MEDDLELYAAPYDPARPVVCLAEKPVTLHADASPHLPVRPGIPARFDYEYVRCGTANLFVCVEPLRGYRHITPTDRRTMQDSAQIIKWLVDEAYPNVDLIRLVQNNLNTHLPSSLYDTFAPSEARPSIRTPRRRSRSMLSPVESGIKLRSCRTAPACYSHKRGPLPAS